jgi:VIT1/CCC1 family predicted Fe2+/Mn2+ transporter
MDESIENQIRDYTLGGIDGLTVPVSVAAGLVAAGATNQIIVMAIIAEMIAGGTNTGLTEYLSIDGEHEMTDIAWKSGLRVAISYMLGASISLFIYKFTKDPITGLKLSIIVNTIALLIFGYYRAVYLKLPILESIKKSLFVGITAMFVTYFISKIITNIK